MAELRKALFLLLILCFVVAISKTGMVKADLKPIVVPDDYATIQEAVDNAPEGGTVFVRSGSYSERVIVNKPLSLIGEDPETTDISIWIFGRSYGAIEVLAEDVTISGFTIKDTMSGIVIKGGVSPPSRCKIIGNNIVNNSRWGIFCTSLVEQENHIISGNNISGNGDGMYVNGPNSVISGNNITGNRLRGVLTDSGRNITFSGNNISNNGAALDIGGDGPIYVYGNNITDNDGHGVQFDDCSNATVYQNNIIRNGVGINLNNYGAFEEQPSLGFGNIVYQNNVVNNSVQVIVDHVYEMATVWSEHEFINGTDTVAWDNGIEGNYWSDYTGTGMYVIDENNTDHYPLTNPVTISVTPPPIHDSFSDSMLAIVASVAAAVVVLVVAFTVYKTRK
ncbi:MAG: right-handed parallel beta-helix repeat-containing protein [Candidatus Bathyarchaeota archaeon]|jgi:nitrous oxidase accessory protein NosD